MAHILLALGLQTITGLALRRWLIGGLMSAAFYLGREFTQAEYRWISTFGDGLRANMPWWGGIDPRVWSAKSVFDFVLPLAASLCLWAAIKLVFKYPR